MKSKTNLIPHLAISSVAFVIFIVLGTMLSSEIKTELIAQIQATLTPISSMGVIPLIILIFFNNAFKCFLIIVMGIILGLPSLLFLCFNAIIIGALASYMGSEAGPGIVIASLAPHGIIEIPLLVFSVALGLSIGAEGLKSIMKQKNELKAQYGYSLKVYCRWMIALFFIAALIEVFVTPQVIALTGGTAGLLSP